MQSVRSIYESIRTVTWFAIITQQGLAPRQRKVVGVALKQLTNKSKNPAPGCHERARSPNQPCDLTYALTCIFRVCIMVEEIFMRKGLRRYSYVVLF